MGAIRRSKLCRTCSTSPTAAPSVHESSPICILLHMLLCNHSGAALLDEMAVAVRERRQDEASLAGSDTAPAILLHHAVPTRSCRVAWLLEELDIPYKTRPVDFPTETRSAEYRQCNVAGMCASMGASYVVPVTMPSSRIGSVHVMAGLHQSLHRTTQTSHALRQCASG